MHYTYKTKHTCASKIDFDIEDNIITNIKFTGGCPGNLKAIEKLLDGFHAEQIIEKCKGNTCGFKQTSCTDQLALATQEAYKNSHNK